MPVALLHFYLFCGAIAAMLATWFAAKRDASMLKRSLTILLLLHIVVAILWMGQWGCLAFATLLCGVGAYEVSRHNLGGPWAMAVAVGAIVAAWGAYCWESPLWWVPWAGAAIVTFAASAVFVARPFWTLVFALTVIAFGCAGLMKLAEPVPVIWMSLILIVQFNDTLGLLVGKRWGKRKLFPMLSPNKSVEGFVAGLLGVGLAMAACGLLFADYWSVRGPFIEQPNIAEVAGLIGAACMAAWLVANAGDLLFSKYKRAQGIKDFSAILPGHGGIIDRFDSLLVLAPAAYLALGH